MISIFVWKPFDLLAIYMYIVLYVSQRIDKQAWECMFVWEVTSQDKEKVQARCNCLGYYNPGAVNPAIRFLRVQCRASRF